MEKCLYFLMLICCCSWQTKFILCEKSEVLKDDLQSSASSASLFNILGHNYPASGGSSFGNYNGYGGSGHGYNGYGKTNVIGLNPNQGGYHYPTPGYGGYGGYGGYNGYNGYGGYSGYGGYGGYGGNGGHNSYYGYLNPYYTGHRNLGFGYYSKTDGYGFPNGNGLYSG